MYLAGSPLRVERRKTRKRSDRENLYGGRFPGGPILIPFPMTKLRFWRNTTIATTAPGGTGSLQKHYLGYEWDETPRMVFVHRG